VLEVSEQSPAYHVSDDVAGVDHASCGHVCFEIIIELGVFLYCDIHILLQSALHDFEFLSFLIDFQSIKD